MGGMSSADVPGLVPYDVVTELWSDNAHKRRWIGLPDGAPVMALSATGAWAAPDEAHTFDWPLDHGTARDG